MIMTEDGIVPMSKVQTLDQIALQNVAVTQPIQPEWIKAVIERTGLVGWQVTLWSLQSMAIINLPKSSTADRTQFVVNARTGAWARYSGWDANCFAVFNNSLFYGSSDGRVMQAETGSADDGQTTRRQFSLRSPHWAAASIKSNCALSILTLPQISIRN